MNLRLHVLLGCAVALAFGASLAAGHAPIADLLRGFASDPTLRGILLELRLPRAVLGLLVGATLGLAGAALQGFLRNPLADAGLIGVSASAALGAVLVLYTGLAASFGLMLPLGGLAGAAAGMAIVYLLAGREGSLLALILTGVAVNSLAAALTALALNFAPNPYAALEIVHWLLGSLADRSFDHVALAAPFMLAGWTLLLAGARGLDALTLGEDAAASLGVDLRRLRLLVIGGSALAVGAAVAVSGSVGFVGLVVPHLLRGRVGQRPGALLVASALGGALLVLLADTIVRMVPTEFELKLGVVTALIGAPFFLHLLWRLRRQLT